MALVRLESEDKQPITPRTGKESIKAYVDLSTIFEGGYPKFYYHHTENTLGSPGVAIGSDELKFSERGNQVNFKDASGRGFIVTILRLDIDEKEFKDGSHSI